MNLNFAAAPRARVIFFDLLRTAVPVPVADQTVRSNPADPAGGPSKQTRRSRETLQATTHAYFSPRTESSRVMTMARMVLVRRRLVLSASHLAPPNKFSHSNVKCSRSFLRRSWATGTPHTHPCQYQHRAIATTTGVSAAAATQSQGGGLMDPAKEIERVASIKFKRDGVLIDPEKEVDRLVGILSVLPSKLLHPPSLIANQIIALLMHLATHPRKDSGPLASCIMDAIRANQSSGVPPSLQMYHLAIECWIKSEVDDGIGPAYGLLLELLLDENQSMELMHLGVDSKDIDRVNSSFALVVHSLLTIVDVDGETKKEHLERAMALIESMRQLYNDTTCGLVPNITSTNAILNVLSHVGDERSAEQAVKLLSDVVQLHSNDSTGNIEPNTTSFAIVIHHLAKIGNVRGAEDLLHWMLQLHSDGKISAKPDIFCYNSILDGLSKSKRANAPQDAENMLKKMESIGGDLSPNTVSYTSCIHAYARRRLPKRAEYILRRMIWAYEDGNERVKPDVTSFGAVANAWALAGGQEGVEKAEALVAWLEELYRDRTEPTMAPNVVLYNALANAWAHAKTKVSGDNAFRVLKRMRAQGIEPNTRTINTILTALARSSDGKRAVIKAENIMEDAQSGTLSAPLDIISFNAYLDCLARNGAPDGCQRVTKTFAMMKEVGVLPTRITFNTAMNLLAKSKDEGSTRMALRILETMETSDDPSIRPNERSYSACINAVARSSDPDRAQVAHEIYQRLEKSTTQTINGVLSACSFLPKDKQQDGVSIAIKLIDELKQRSDIFPDHITFSTMFKVIGTSMPPSKARKEIARSLFHECCKEGLLSELVIRNMKKSVTQSVFRELVRPTNDGNDNIPSEWRRNVKSGNSRRQQ